MVMVPSHDATRVLSSHRCHFGLSQLLSPTPSVCLSHSLPNLPTSVGTNSISLLSFMGLGQPQTTPHSSPELLYPGQTPFPEFIKVESLKLFGEYQAA